MSTDPQLENGGGSGGGSTDGSTTDSTSSSGGTINVLLPDWVVALRPLAPIAGAIARFFADPRYRAAFMVASLTGLGIDVVYNLLDAGKSPVAIIIDDYLFRTILLPIAFSIFTAGLNAINEFILLTFGTDRRVGVAPGSRPGLVDIPIGLAVEFSTGLIVAGLTVFNTVAIFNNSIAGDLAGIGLAAPVWVSFLWVIEMIAIGATLWLLISFIPVFNVRGVLLSLTAIPRRVLNRLL